MPASQYSRRNLLVETVLVLGVGLGASAVWALLNIINRLTLGPALSQQSSSLNNSVTPDRPWLDLAYQLVGIVVALMPALLALFLLRRDIPDADSAIGMDGAHPRRDALQGAGLALLIGVPGLGLYLVARSLGVNTTVAAANLGDTWWSIPVLILAALQNAFVEELVMIGYLVTRWSQIGWSLPRILITSAVIRGTYHLYQGFGAFVGNIVMGLIFGWFYAKTRRVMPLIIAHALIDIVAFLGYALLRDQLSWL